MGNEASGVLKNSAKIIIFSVILLAVNMAFFQIQARSVDYSSPDLVKLEREQNEARIKKLKKEREKLLKDKKNVAKVLDKLDGEIRSAEKDLGAVQKEHKQLMSETVYLEQRLKQANVKYSEYRSRNNDRLVAYYKNGRAGYLEVLFNATSFTDFISRVYYLKLLTKHDLGVVQKMKNLSAEVIDKKVTIEKHAQEIKVQEARLKEQKSYNQKLHKEKKSALKEIEEDAILLEQQLAILEAENQQLESLLKNAKSRDLLVPSFGGTFSSPVCSNQFYITSPFGYRKSPKKRASSNHKGMDLRAAYNSDVCAAADGEVLESSWARGYGNHIVIMHGSGYATVYGHGLKNLVKSGQKVKRGQVIMKADSTGVSTGNHLHFEVRKDGVAIEPSKFFCGYSVTKSGVTCN